MRRLVLLALVAIALPTPAEARHCPSGQILRVSMGRCVSARSRMAYGYVRARSIRHHHRYAMVLEDDPPAPRVNHKHRGDRLQMLQIVEPPADPVIVEPPPEVEIPYGIYGSRMMHLQTHRFDWIKP